MEDDFEVGDMFQDPEGFYPEEKPATFSEHQMLCGKTVRVRLVGSHPLYVRPRPGRANRMICPSMAR
jgi:nicotinamide N-methyltransferase